ncbi:hypothetical protein DRN69_00040 [Candidatus Pacearchaeota archaeon]|nr:MAG: hypothetical protein DRN69_00040 [Candidatus Pacearchaeota archaeon]
MGIDLVIYVKKDDVRRLLDIDSDYPDWSAFLFLLKKQVRFYRFLEEMGLDERTREINSKELLVHLAKTNKKIEDRDEWVEILSKFDLIFAPDTYTDINEEEYVPLDVVEHGVYDVIRKHFNEVMEFLESGVV